ncbi:unnamed protein product [Kuraishia capsulata CBS 1993]|uniref:AAA+ ATPase domain-containing protein n=1 Tax=Kuraishia capsulata CBS 1993 TaxID=1382522 RepID=W6MQH6_9ASCO|nr:uncharacterized protein KUCA_T00003490001 [Kuraishia capsulata CBS 1993]CDK27512.1 unnamed protein product [Kuraishia capsulata CBS 1993]
MIVAKSAFRAKPVALALLRYPHVSASFIRLQRTIGTAPSDSDKTESEMKDHKKDDVFIPRVSFKSKSVQTSAAHEDLSEIAGPGKFSKKHGFSETSEHGIFLVDDDSTVESTLRADFGFNAADYEEKLVKLPTPRQLKSYLDKYIVGQDSCKKVMSVAVYNHYIRINDATIRGFEKRQALKKEAVEQLFRNTHGIDTPLSIDVEKLESTSDVPELEKSNVLLLGPSGSGKTLIAKTLAKVLNVPIVIQDCTSLTQSGYVGDDIESCIEKLLIKANYDVDLCQQGIIVLDEIDKLAKPSVYTGTKDIGGEGVQQGLLKLIEGTNISVQAKKQAPKDANSAGGMDRPTVSVRSGGETYTVDTSQILFVSMGAFIGLDGIVASRLASSVMGFGVEDNSVTAAEQESGDAVEYVTLPNGKRVSALDAVSPTDLHTFGLIPELIGRIPIVSALSPLTTQDLVSILTEPKNSIIKQYEYFFSRFKVRLAITHTAIEHIARLSLKNGTGARGLRSVLEKILLAVNYDCPGSGVSFVLIDDEVITSFNEPNEASSSKELKAKYFSRGEIFKFLNELGNEDPILKKQIEEEYQIPSSDKVSASRGKKRKARA